MVMVEKQTAQYLGRILVEKRTQAFCDLKEPNISSLHFLAFVSLSVGVCCSFVARSLPVCYSVIAHLWFGPHSSVVRFLPIPCHNSAGEGVFCANTIQRLNFSRPLRWLRFIKKCAKTRLPRQFFPAEGASLL